MNTYNENLRSAIVSSLQNQNTEQKDLQSQLNSTMFSLYHAEGASITAGEKLNQATLDQVSKAEVKKQAVANSNASNNELKSATQADALVKQSVSNAATCAANVQIAANAVTKLASDVGSIYSIINAADYDTDIYAQAEEINQLMNDTAYGAELNSKLAMEFSTLTSEVSSSIVLNESKSTNSAVKNLLKIASDEFDTASQTVVDDNAALSGTNAKEKDIEGNYKYLSVDYNAASHAYNSINKELNQNLRVITGQSDTSFTVKFNKILNPFYDTNPVKNYYIFVVKESKANTFSISSAESIIAKNDRRFVEVQIPERPVIAGEEIEDKTEQELIITEALFPVTSNTISEQIDFLNVDDGQTLLDSEGKAITLGESYVVFLMAVYTDQYKRSINNYSDFLSAPSLSFVITTHLNAVDSSNITVTSQKSEKSQEDIQSEEDFTVFFNQSKSNDQINNITAKKPEYSYKITFSVEQDPSYKVEYRFMLLPVYKGTGEDLLTMNTMKSFINEISSLDLIAAEFDPKIDAIQKKITETNLRLQQPEVEDEKGLSKLLKDLNSKLKSLNQDKNSKIKGLRGSNTDSNIGFFFNLPLAEQVPAGSYVPAKQDSTTNDAPDTTNWLSYISSDTTDNFGNLLIEGNKYIPVVLTYAVLENAGESPFTNALSDFNATKPFVYNELS